MTLKQLLEILENVKVYTSYNDKTECKEAYQICEFKEEDLNKNIKNFEYGCLPGKLNYSFNYEIDEEKNTTLSPVTIKELFRVLKNKNIFYWSANDIPMKIIVKTPRGIEIIYWHGGVKVEGFVKIKPWGWNRFQNLVVEEISEINRHTDFKLTIIARED